MSTAETLRFTCDRSPGGFAIALCLTADLGDGETSAESRAGFGCALYGQTDTPPAYLCSWDVNEVPAKIAASHAERSR